MQVRLAGIMVWMRRVSDCLRDVTWVSLSLMQSHMVHYIYFCGITAWSYSQIGLVSRTLADFLIKGCLQHTALGELHR